MRSTTGTRIDRCAASLGCEAWAYASGTRPRQSSSTRATLLEYARQAEAVGLELVGDLRPLPAMAPSRWPFAGGAAVAGRGVGRDHDRGAGHQRPDADAALRARDRRPGVRHARVPGARPRVPRRRHGRGDERDARDRRGVPGAQGAAAADGRGDRADPAAVARGARRLRRRVLQDVAGHDLRPPRRARCRSSSPRRARWRPSSPAASATASSAPAARTRSSTSTCSRRSREGAEAAGRDHAQIRRMIEIKVSYDRDTREGL